MKTSLQSLSEEVKYWKDIKRDLKDRQDHLEEEIKKVNEKLRKAKKDYKDFLNSLVD